MLADDSDTPSVSNLSARVGYDDAMRRFAPFLYTAFAGLMLGGCDGSEPAKTAPPKSVPSVSAATPAAVRPPAPLAPKSSHDAAEAPAQTNSNPKSLQRLPMPRILAIATARVAGEVLEVEFEEADEKDGPEYEVSILTPDGLILEVKLDAISGKILKIEED